MRFVTGVLFGIILTIGAAYVVDAVRGAPGADGRPGMQMVNWVVVGDTMRSASTGVQDLWARLVGSAKQLDKQLYKPANS